MSKYPFPHLLNPGHTACAGCGQLIAARQVVDAAGSNTIIANATGCLEVTTSAYCCSSWKVPWIHSLFENPAAVASGILVALKARGEADKVKVIAQGGDGSTFDIGFGIISGMWDREEDILYVCYDNGIYANTGAQASGATPLGAMTTTTPVGGDYLGNQSPKKDLPTIALSHELSYVATATVGYPLDIRAKIKKALTFKGPKYIQILVGCTPGWGYDSDLTVYLGKLAHQTGLYPIWEGEKGKITKAMPFPKSPPKVEEYLKPQKRFGHLFKNESGQKIIEYLQNLASENIKKFTLDKVG